MTSSNKVVFNNPIIPGFSPDPSIINVNGTFFLVTSSFQAFPGIPIYASEDLRSWHHIGNAINSKQQLSLSKSGTLATVDSEGKLFIGSTGLFAPTIRHHQGIFYIICTNASFDRSLKVENFYITTNNIFSGQWNDPIYFHWQGIDPSLFFDDDGKVYIQGCYMISESFPKCTIKQVEVDITTGNLCSEPKEIWSGWDKRDTEGPHVYKKDGYYYLIAAEGGTFENHMLSIARSKSIWGPFESFERNPILTATGSSEYIQCIGHGDLFQDDSGEWWYVTLGVRKDHNGRSPLSRETFLTSVDWQTGEWPKIEQPKIQFERAWNNSRQTDQLSEQVRKASPHVEDVYIRQPNLEDYAFSVGGRSIELVASSGTLDDQQGSITFVGRRQRHLKSYATTTLELKDLDGSRTTIQAGLTLYKDPLRHAEIFFDYKSHQIILNISCKTTGFSMIEKRNYSASNSAIQFKIQANEESYTFLFRDANETSEFTQLGEVNTSHFTARDMIGPLFAVYSVGEGSGIGSKITFTGFEVSPQGLALL